MNVPCSPTPVGPPRSAATALRCCLPPIGKRRLPRQILISGLNHTACSLAVYASRGGLLHRHARLASGWLASLVRAGMTPLGPTERFQVYSILLPQALPGAPKFEYQKGPRRMCVQRRLARSAGDSPAKAEARSLVARMAGRRETDDLKPIDNAIIGMAASQRAVAQANA